MNNLEIIVEKYLTFCNDQKQLDRKTLKAYRTDLKQFFWTDNGNRSHRDYSKYTRKVYYQSSPKILT